MEKGTGDGNAVERPKLSHSPGGGGWAQKGLTMNPHASNGKRWGRWLELTVGDSRIS